MDLKINDVAELLNVSVATIRKWVDAGTIPCYRIDDELLFNRTEIENWVLNNKPHLETEEHLTKRGGTKQFSLYRAVNHGGVYSPIAGQTKQEVIRNAIQQGIAARLDLDPEGIASLLLDRETLHSTALGRGIAIPHTRDFLLPGHRDLIAVAYPEHPIPYNALDGEPVHTLFFLFACNDKRHLHLLAKIAHLCSNPKARDFFARKPSEATLLAYIKEWEGAIQTVDA